MSALWARLSSASAVNMAKWDIELAWIIRTSGFKGVRFNIALGDPEAIDSRIVCTEAGVSHQFVGQTDDPSMDSVGSMTANYFKHYQRQHEAVLAYLDKLEEVGFEWVTHFAVTDSSSSQSQQFGIFDFGLTDGSRPEILPRLTYASALAWAKRFGMPTTKGTPPDYDDAGNYWNVDFIRGDKEDVP